MIPVCTTSDTILVPASFPFWLAFFDSMSTSNTAFPPALATEILPVPAYPLVVASLQNDESRRPLNSGEKRRVPPPARALLRHRSVPGGTAPPAPWPGLQRRTRGYRSARFGPSRFRPGPAYRPRPTQPPALGHRQPATTADTPASVPRAAQEPPAPGTADTRRRRVRGRALTLSPCRTLKSSAT